MWTGWKLSNIQDSILFKNGMTQCTGNNLTDVESQANIEANSSSTTQQ